MDLFFTLNQLIKKNLVPSKGARRSGPNKDQYNIEKTEPSVSGPYFAPLKKAKLFYTTNGTIANFRESESEKTYSKSALKREFGVKSVDGVTPYSEAYSRKLRGYYNLYRLSDFNITEKEPTEIIFDSQYSLFKENLSRKNGYCYKSKDFDICLSVSNIIIDFHCFNASIEIKIQLKKICKSFSDEFKSNADKALNKEIIFPIVSCIDRSLVKIKKTVLPVAISNKIEITADSYDNNEIIESLSKMKKIMTLEKDKQTTFHSLMSKKPYHELFPSRKINRNITLFIAPTNSGKTYQACKIIKKKIKSNPNDIASCYFPLRALAAQIKDDFMQDGYSSNLITGEEREIKSDARITCSTVEMLNSSIYQETIFIDECQMIFDEGKQAAYTKAILGAYCNDLILSVAPYYADSLINLLERYTNDNINIINLDRLCPLESCGTVNIKDVQKGDIVVAYRVKSIHYIAEAIRRQGLKVGVIYGKMSPSARRSMISGFQEKGCDCLVSTDAIGMGLSIPAKRVLIAEGTKFDGKNVRKLTQEEIRQVAGRAGRFGFYDIGYVGSLPISNHPISIKDINNSLNVTEKYPNKNSLFVSPDKHMIKSAVSLSLGDSLIVWKEAVKTHNNIKISSSSYNELTKKAYFLDKLENQDRNLLVDLLFIVYPSTRDQLWHHLYLHIIRDIISREKTEIHSFSEHYLTANKIEELENKSIYLTLMSQFQRVVPELFPSEKEIMQEQEDTGTRLANKLLEKYTKKPTPKKKKFKYRKTDPKLPYHIKIFKRATDRFNYGYTKTNIEKYINDACHEKVHKERILEYAIKENSKLLPIIKKAFSQIT